jgi:hypothetical protein
MLHAQAACFMSMLHVHEAVYSACPCCMSLLYVNASCPYCMSMLHVHAAMLHVHAACPCCMSLMHVSAACSCRMFLIDIHVAFCCCMSLLLVHATCPFCMYCTCCKDVLHYILPVLSTFPCCMSVLHAHVIMHVHMSMLHVLKRNGSCFAELHFEAKKIELKPVHPRTVPVTVYSSFIFSFVFSRFSKIVSES